MKDYDVVLASGAEHLRERFEENGFRVFTSNLNYDSRRLFPNTDIYARIGRVSELSNRKVVVVQSCTGAGPAEFERYTTSDRVLELLLLLDILAQPVEVEKIGHKNFKEMRKNISGYILSILSGILTITKNLEKYWPVPPSGRNLKMTIYSIFIHLQAKAKRK